jgi:hypothetical protein
MEAKERANTVGLFTRKLLELVSNLNDMSFIYVELTARERNKKKNEK